MPQPYSKPAAGGASVAGETRSKAGGKSRLNLVGGRRASVTGERRGSVAGERPGFTLLELLIVVAIIGILAVVAVFSYVGVQRQATVDFAADTVVSALREAQDLARSGRRGGEAEAASDAGGGGGGGASGNGVASTSGGSAALEGTFALCQVVKLVPGPADQGGGLFTAVSKYVAVDGDLVDACTVLGDDAGWRRSEGLGGRLEIVNLSGTGGAGGAGGGAAQVFYFKPPFGKIFSPDAVGGSMQSVEARLFTFKIGDPDNPVWDREVVFDTATGEAKKRLPSASQ